MTTKVYHCARFPTVGEFWYRADFSNGAAPIWVSFFPHTGDWQPMPFQVANARHWRKETERMIAEHFR